MQDLFDQRSFSVGVGFAVIAEFFREGIFQFGVATCIRGVGAQVIPEQQLHLEETAAGFHHVKVVGVLVVDDAVQVTAFGQEGFMARDVLVPQGFEGRDKEGRIIQAVNADHYIDHRLGGQTRNSSAADVFDAAQIGADGFQEAHLFMLEEQRPGRVIGEDVDGDIIAHTVIIQIKCA